MARFEAHRPVKSYKENKPDRGAVRTRIDYIPGLLDRTYMMYQASYTLRRKGNVTSTSALCGLRTPASPKSPMLLWATRMI